MKQIKEIEGLKSTLLSYPNIAKVFVNPKGEYFFNSVQAKQSLEDGEKLETYSSDEILGVKSKSKATAKTDDGDGQADDSKKGDLKPDPKSEGETKTETKE
jgi:hypothetical protein